MTTTLIQKFNSCYYIVVRLDSEQNIFISSNIDGATWIGYSNIGTIGGTFGWHTESCDSPYDNLTISGGREVSNNQGAVVLTEGNWEARSQSEKALCACEYQAKTMPPTPVPTELCSAGTYREGSSCRQCPPGSYTDDTNAITW